MYDTLLFALWSMDWESRIVWGVNALMLVGGIIIGIIHMLNGSVDWFAWVTAIVGLINISHPVLKISS